jgi:hypothetical protein
MSSEDMLNLPPVSALVQKEAAQLALDCLIHTNNTNTGGLKGKLKTYKDFHKLWTSIFQAGIIMSDSRATHGQHERILSTLN